MQERTKRRLRRYRRNLKEVRWYTFWRFWSILALCTVFSATATFLNFNEKIFVDDKTLLYGLSVMCFLFLSFDVCLMRRDYYKIAHKRKYRMVSYISHGVFALINVVTGIFFSHTQTYAVVFGITKFLRFSHQQVSSALSALVFNAAVMIFIELAYIGMHWLDLDHG